MPEPLADPGARLAGEQQQRRVRMPQVMYDAFVCGPTRSPPSGSRTMPLTRSLSPAFVW